MITVQFEIVVIVPLAGFAVRDGDQPEGICAMARPVVIGTKSDAALFVALLVIEADCLQPTSTAIFIEPHLREEAAGRFDALHGRANPLIGDYLHLKFRLLQRAFICGLEDLFMRRAVMRENAKGILVSLRSQPLHMNRKGLAHRFVIVEKPDFTADKLNNPDGGRIRLRARSADVPNRPQGHERVGGYAAYAAILAGLVKVSGIIGTINDCEILAFPDMPILVGTLTLVFQALPFENFREPWIIAPIHLHDLDAGIIVIGMAEALVGSRLREALGSA